MEIEIASATNLSIDQGKVYEANLWLSTVGVGKVNEVFNESLSGEIFFNGGILPRAITFRLRGTNIPTGARASLTLNLLVEYTMEYTVCEKTPDLFFGPGDDQECSF